MSQLLMRRLEQAFADEWPELGFLLNGGFCCPFCKDSCGLENRAFHIVPMEAILFDFDRKICKPSRFGDMLRVYCAECDEEIRPEDIEDGRVHGEADAVSKDDA